MVLNNYGNVNIGELTAGDKNVMSVYAPVVASLELTKDFTFGQE